MPPAVSAPVRQRWDAYYAQISAPPHNATNCGGHHRLHFFPRFNTAVHLLAWWVAIWPTVLNLAVGYVANHVLEFTTPRPIDLGCIGW